VRSDPLQAVAAVEAVVELTLEPNSTVTGIFSVLSGTFFWLGKLLVMQVPDTRDVPDATGGKREVPLLALVDPSTVRVLWAFCGLLIETIPTSLAVERGSSDQTLISFFGMLRATWRLLSWGGTLAVCVCVRVCV
jgi:hypothetical protein